MTKMDEDARRQAFSKIKRAYAQRDEEMLSGGRLPMRSTEVGFWGVSNMDDVYAWFSEMDFPKETTFCDLGCGDGRVVLIASLFVTATGIEYDEELTGVGKKIALELGLSCTLHCDDILDHDVSLFAMLYMYADRNFAYLEPKLRNELRGTLYLYHDTYHPQGFVKGKITWIGQIPIFSYTLPRT